ncbi:sporulation protein Cse60 [Cytobacillus praedii]|uniref:sporulation protein Cse60 n=1 Tax=Cytobacillus praedii TaxID=1742358 RepID=UPI002E23BFD8|nr:sporulation protein Cse60 [Cytobacillus praedii]
MIQTRVVSEYLKDFQSTLNQALRDLRNQEIIDVKFAVNKESITEQETYTAMILYKD